MTQQPISAADPHDRHRVAVLDTEIAYVDTGGQHPVVFLHGNPTSSYLWRNVIGIPHEEASARCLAPDLIGMGRSGKAPDGSYRFVDHARYLDAWFDALGLTDNVTLVGHDWGSALAFHWAYRHPDRVRALVYMEAIVRPGRWDEMTGRGREMFQALRSPAGEQMVLQENAFVERMLPSGVIRTLTEEEMDAYRAPYLEPGESRRPTLTWPRQVSLDGEPADTTAIIGEYSQWLATASDDIPKLFINAEPGAIITGSRRDFVRTWPNQREITVPGRHFIQEDSPHEIGRAITDFLNGLSDRQPTRR